jgi:putative endonuclease
VGQGYRILHRNYRTRLGEIDVVAEHGGVLCFVEIKARATPLHGSPMGAVTLDQRRRVARAAALYLQRSGFEGDCRFDVLGMAWSESGWRFDLVRGAFLADGSAP